MKKGMVCVMCILAGFLMAEYMVNHDFCVVSTVTPSFRTVERFTKTTGKVIDAFSVSVPVAEAHHVWMAQEVILQTDEKSYIGNVVQKVTQSGVRTVLIESHFPLTEETTVQVKFREFTEADVLLIPTDAVFFRDGKKYVFLNRYGIAREKEVICGEQFELETEILSGLTKEDVIIRFPIKSGVYQGAQLDCITPVK